MMVKLAKLTGLLTGLNWYRLGLYAAIVLGYTAAVGGYGYHKGALNCEQKKTEAAEEHVREVVREVEVRVPVVQIREVESAKQRAEIARLKEKLDEAIAKKPANPACNLSSDERDGFNDLLKKTRPAK